MTWDPLYENEDHYENEDPPTKRKTHHENEGTFLKQVQKRLVLPLWTKIMFMRHTTKTVEPHGTFNGTTLKPKREKRHDMHIMV